MNDPDLKHIPEHLRQYIITDTERSRDPEFLDLYHKYKDQDIEMLERAKAYGDKLDDKIDKKVVNTIRDYIYADYDEYSEDKICISNQEPLYQISECYENPQYLFSTDGIRELKEKNHDQSDRLIMIYHAVRTLKCNPTEAKNYFEAFPEDLDLIIYFIGANYSPLHPEEEYIKIYTAIAYPFIPQEAKEYIFFEPTNDEIDYIDIQTFNETYGLMSQRLETAHNYIINNFNPNDIYKLLSITSLASLKEAEELFFKADSIVISTFEKMQDPLGNSFYQKNEEDKAAYLRTSLSALQYKLLFNETFHWERISSLEDAYNKNERWLIEHVHTITDKNTYSPDVYSSDLPDEINPMVHPWQNIFSERRFIGEYGYHYLTLDIIIELGKVTKDREKNINLLIEFLIKNGDPLFISETAISLAKIDPDYSITKLLEILRSEEISDSARNVIEGVLHRLELRKIDITDEGYFIYLKTKYRLRNLKYQSSEGETKQIDSHCHAKRLTPHGDIIFFGENNEVIGTLKCGSLAADEEIEVELADILYEDFFLISYDDTPEHLRESKMKALESFKKNYFPVAEQFEQDFVNTGVKLSNLEKDEQIWVVSLYDPESSVNIDIEKLSAFAKTYREPGIKTFIAMELGEKNGELILDLAEKLGEDQMTGDLIFRKFNNVAKYLRKTNQEVSDEFLKKSETVDATREILKNALKILQKCHQMIEKDPSKENRAAIREKIIMYLNDLKIDAEVKKAIIKSLYLEDPNNVLEKIKDFDTSSFNMKDIEEHEKNKILAEILDLSNRVYGENSDKSVYIHKTLKEKFSGESANTRWFIVREKGKVIATMRFDLMKDGTVYAGSFMVDPESSGYKIGSSMENDILKPISERFAVRAHTPVNGKPIEHYLRKEIGWAITGISNFEEIEAPLFDIIRDDEVNEMYKSPDLTADQILELAKRTSLLEEGKEFEEDIFAYQVDEIPSEEDLNRVNIACKQGFVGKFLLRDLENRTTFDGQGYLVFEKAHRSRRIKEEKIDLPHETMTLEDIPFSYRDIGDQAAA